MWISDLSRIEDPAELAAEMSHLPLGCYLIWATYRYPERVGDPFDSLPLARNDLMDVMGLDPIDKGKPLLLFVYEPPDGEPIRFPTIADAQWQVRFRPAPRGEEVDAGLTLPLRDAPGRGPIGARR
jgi:hypothetical protein